MLLHSRCRKLIRLQGAKHVAPPAFSSGISRGFGCSLVGSSWAQVVTTTLPVGNSPVFPQRIPVTNTAYVANQLCSTPPCTVPGTVTVIDGATNSIKATVNVGINPGPIVANSVTNRIYVANTCGGDSTCQSRGTITVIDGATLATTNLTVGYVPSDIAINSVTQQDLRGERVPWARLSEFLSDLCDGDDGHADGNRWEYFSHAKCSHHLLAQRRGC